MATKVFICWGGELSKKLGEALRSWLPSSLQYVRPYFSPEDIEKGAKWSSEITKELETSSVGIICVTPENAERPWIMFESGALSKHLEKARVCPLLFNLEPADVKGPLTLFQATRFAKDDFKRLVATINNAAGDARLEPTVLDGVFDMWWPKLEEQVSAITRSHKSSPKEARRSDRDVLDEVLELTRMNASRAARPGRALGPRVLSDLASAFDELVRSCGTIGDQGHHALYVFDRALMHACHEVGALEIYERHRMHVADLPTPEREYQRLEQLREAERRQRELEAATTAAVAVREATAKG